MITFYVSGHGYGHATRSAAVMRAIRAASPDCRIAVRTMAPAMLFGSGVLYNEAAVEPPIVETADALSVDLPESARALRSFLANAGELLATEERFVRGTGTRLIVADIPFLAGEVARRTGVRAVAMGNFLWHWVLAAAADEGLLESIRRGYSGFSLALRMPLSHDDGWEVFPEVIDVPLVTPRSQRSREKIRRELRLTGLAVLLGGRGRLGGAALERVKRESPEFRFLMPEDAPVYSDLVRACDIMASKIGYSVAAECIAEQKRLLFPPRTGFPEEQILRAEAPRHMPALAIPPGEWMAGNWRPWLLELAGMPERRSSIRVDGASFCAEVLLSRLPG